MSAIQHTAKKHSFPPHPHLNAYHSRNTRPLSFTNQQSAQQFDPKKISKQPFQKLSETNVFLVYWNSVLINLQKPCCQKPIQSPKTNIQEILLIPDPQLYIMPCGHTICMDCITKTIKQGESTITCLKRNCQKKYGIQEAQCLFTRNTIIIELLRKIPLLDFWKEIDFPQKGVSFRENIVESNKLVPSNKANIFGATQKYWQSKEPKQIRENSYSSSEEDCFNSCVNIFCKKPTVGLFCSSQCEMLYEKLQLWD